jgi:hypothetical protein
MVAHATPARRVDENVVRGDGPKVLTQTGECGSEDEFTPRPAGHKFAQCNNQLHCSRLIMPSHRRFPPPWSVDHSPSTRRVCSIRISSAMLVVDSRTNSANGAVGRYERQDSAGMRLAYCRGGIGVRDDGGAIGARDDGGTGVGLRAGATDGCAGGSGIFAISSATAASNRAISRAIWS